MRLRLLLIIAVFSFIFTTTTSHAAEDYKTYRFGAHISSVGGLSASELFELLQKMSDLMLSEYGMHVKPVKFSSEEEFFTAFLNNDIDIGSLFPASIAEVMEKGSGVYPLATYRLGKDDLISQCLWHAKDLKINSINDVKGKSLMRQDYDPYPYVQLRDFLFTKGIDQPLWKTFKSFAVVPGSNSAFMAIAIKEGDFHWAPNELKVPLKLFLPNVLPQVQDDICSEEMYGRPIVVMNKATVSQKEFEEFKGMVKKFVSNLDKYAIKDPYFKMIVQYMKLGDVHIANGSLDLIKQDIALYNKAKKNGWLKEADFIVENLKKNPVGTHVEIKMDFKACKQSCAALKDNKQIECIDECMKN